MAILINKVTGGFTCEVNPPHAEKCYLSKSPMALEDIVAELVLMGIDPNEITKAVGELCYELNPEEIIPGIQ